MAAAAETQMAAARVREDEQREEREDGGGADGGKSGGGRRRRVHNRDRALVFTRWLLEWLPPKVLKAGAGVVDVAGGSGELSFQLHTLRDIPSCIVDPRPELGLQKLVQRYEHYRQNRAARHSGSDGTGTDRPDLVRSWHLTPLTAKPPPRHLAIGFPLVWQQRSFESHVKGQEQKASEQHGELFDTLHAASAIIGLHPDQATEAIVDFAVLNSKPFAVVPCCVFPQLFQNRRLKSGERVRTYDEFCAFLVEKDVRIRTARLDFEGRNLVVFFEPNASHT